ncbi:hypothetical protein LX36DRAFT_690433 [Colletotrichum falcatum]|nr:hypothetical protein LX36DRAFT_690433 [Colletotrichum falcatum]
MGDEQFQKHLEIVRDVIKDYGLEPLGIATVDYEDNTPFQYNNFIYNDCVSTLIMRLANPRAQGVFHETRVENEVAAMHLDRQGLLSSVKPDAAALVPALYDWQSSNNSPSGFGWSLMEFKEGVPLDTLFWDMLIGDKKEVLGQIVNGIQCHGDMTIDGEGSIVSDQMTTLKGGPWESYSAFWKARMALRVDDASASPALDGWKPNGVRERVDKFLAVGLRNFLDESGVDVGRRILIHEDLTTNNMLYDPGTKKLTSVLDFDWAFAPHPCNDDGRLGKAMMTGNCDIPDLPEAAA